MKRIKNNRHLKYFIYFIIFILLNLKYNYRKYILIFSCLHHSYHKIKEISPTEYSLGKIYFSCGFCGNIKIERIPKLNREHYFIETLKANCEHGNGKRYIYKKDKSKIYDDTDDIRLNHSKYGSKCSVCNKTIGEFDFHKLSEFKCYNYPRLYKLSEYWNNTWLLGGDNGTILCHRSNDEGLIILILNTIEKFIVLFLKMVEKHGKI